MSGVGVKIEARNLPEIYRQLSALVLTTGETRELLDEIGGVLADGARLRFRDQQGPDGQPWVPSIRARVQNGQTLRDTGALANSLTHVVMSSTVEVGTNIPYAAPNHFGAHITAVNGPFLRFKIPGGGWARKKEVTLPARPFLGVSNDDELTIMEVIEALFNGRLQ